LAQARLVLARETDGRPLLDCALSPAMLHYLDSKSSLGSGGATQQSPTRTCSWTSLGSMAGLRSTSAETAPPALFPMYAVSIERLLEFGGRLPAHEDLLAEGLLEEVKGDEACVHFVSHVWLSAHHPDPAAQKLRRLQSIFSKIINDDPTGLFDADDWEAFSTGCTRAKSFKTFGVLSSELVGRKPLRPDSFRRDILKGYCWWDYVSVPQKVHQDADAAENKRKAISSMPYYIERSAYFWVLVPDLPHEETRRTVGYEAWQSRGWCRLEEWLNFLSVRTAPSLIVTSAPHVGVLDTMDFLVLRSGIGWLALHAPCNGSFACCDGGHRTELPDGRVAEVPCDREEVANVLLQTFSRRVQHYRDAGKGFMARFLQNASFSALAGSPTAVLPESAEDLLYQCGAKGADANCDGLTPLTWACTCGSAEIVKELLSMKARVDDSVTILHCAAQRGHLEVLRLLLGSGQLSPEHLNRGSPLSNIGGLDRGAKAGHAKVCGVLLLARASPHIVRRDNGQTPLHTAADCGHVGVCEVLLNAGADPNASDVRGRTPLMLAARRLALFGNSAGKARCALLLLQARADPDRMEYSGRLPIDVALEDGHEAFVEVFGQCAANARWGRVEGTCRTGEEEEEDEGAQSRSVVSRFACFPLGTSMCCQSRWSAADAAATRHKVVSL